jgi:peptide deformylase
MTEQQSDIQGAQAEVASPAVRSSVMTSDWGPPRPDLLRDCPEGEVRGLVFWPDWRLKEPSFPFRGGKDEIDGLVANLVATMYATGAVGLSAIQIGIPLRVFVADIYSETPRGVQKSQLLVAVNPVIAFTMGPKERKQEGCMSFPGVQEHITRPAIVGLRGLDRHGEPFALRAGGGLGRVIQHEMDHLDGVTFLEHMSPLARRLAQKKLTKFRRGVRDGNIRPVVRQK